MIRMVLLLSIAGLLPAPGSDATTGGVTREAVLPPSRAEIGARSPSFDFMGIQIGGDLGTSCAIEEIESQRFELPCWIDSDLNNDPRRKRHYYGDRDALLVHTPTNKRPVGTGDVSALVLNGRVEAVTVRTDGFAHQEQIFDQLQVKFGKPDSVRRSPVISAVGAKFDSIEAVWILPTGRAEFVGISSQVTRGFIKVYSNEGFARASKEAARDAASF